MTPKFDLPAPPPSVAPPPMRERIDRLRTLARRALSHWPASLLIVIVGCGLSVAAALHTRPTYRSECVVQFKAGVHIGKDDDSPADKPARLTPKLKDQLLARSRLEAVIKELHLYEKTVEAHGLVEAVDDMREKHVGFRGKDSDTYVISFDDQDQEVARKVAQRLAETMVEEYGQENLGKAKRQALFLAEQEQKSEQELETANGALARFLAAHPEFAQEMKKGAVVGAAQPGLPVLPPPTIVRYGDPQIAVLVRQKERLEAQLHAVQTGTKAAPIVTPADEARRTRLESDREVAQKNLDEASQDLLQKRALGLSEAHPDVKGATSRVAIARGQLAAAEAGVRELEQELRAKALPIEPSATAESLSRELEEVNDRIASRRSVLASPRPQKPGAAASLEPVADLPSGIVALETTFQKLLRAAQETKAQQDDLKQQLDRAKLDLARELAKSSDAMSIRENAYRPLRPSKGGRTRVAMAGGALAALIAILYAAARVLFDDRLIDAADVDALGLIPVLGVLPRVAARKNASSSLARAESPGGGSG